MVSGGGGFLGGVDAGCILYHFTRSGALWPSLCSLCHQAQFLFRLIIVQEHVFDRGHFLRWSLEIVVF